MPGAHLPCPNAVCKLEIWILPKKTKTMIWMSISVELLKFVLPCFVFPFYRSVYEFVSLKEIAFDFYFLTRSFNHENYIPKNY